MRNARFWIFHNGDFVKITLRPNVLSTITITNGGSTDEGYDWMCTTYTHVGHGVEREWDREARDCDGRLESSGEDYCHLEYLKSGNEPYTEHCELDHSEVIYPKWEKLSSRQRDQYAEMMGY